MPSGLSIRVLVATSFAGAFAAVVSNKRSSSAIAQHPHGTEPQIDLAVADFLPEGEFDSLADRRGPAFFDQRRATGGRVDEAESLPPPIQQIEVMPDAGLLNLGSPNEKLDRDQAVPTVAFDNLESEADSLAVVPRIFKQFRLEIRDHGDVGAVS